MISLHSLLPYTSVYFSAAQQALSDASVLFPLCTQALPPGKTWKKTWGHHLALLKQVLPYGFTKKDWPFFSLFVCQLLLPKIVLATLEVKLWKSGEDSFKEEQKVAGFPIIKRVHALNKMSSGLLHFHICLVLEQWFPLVVRGQQGFTHDQPQIGVSRKSFYWEPITIFAILWETMGN